MRNIERKAETDKIRHARLQLDPRHREQRIKYARAWRARNPEKCRGYNKKWKLENPEYARECYLKSLRVKSPERRKAEKKASYLKHIETYKAYGRKRTLGKYGLTPDTFEELFNFQGRRCAICLNSTTPGKKGWHVDHCHVSGKVRGILCNNCNAVLGHARDEVATLQQAISYLERG